MYFLFTIYRPDGLPQVERNVKKIIDNNKALNFNLKLWPLLDSSVNQHQTSHTNPKKKIVLILRMERLRKIQK